MGAKTGRRAPGVTVESPGEHDHGKKGLAKKKKK